VAIFESWKGLFDVQSYGEVQLAKSLLGKKKSNSILELMEFPDYRIKANVSGA